MLIWRGYKPEQNTSLLSAIENDNQIVFPIEYKEIVMRFNKGAPNKKKIQCNGKERVFARLITIAHDTHPNVLDAIKWTEEHTGVFPFGLDPFGNLFAFEYDSIEDYCVVFLDEERGTVHKICSSFSDFLNSLYE